MKRKSSDFIKRRNSILILHWISLGTLSRGLQAQIGNLAKAGYVKIHPGMQYELTAKGRARAELFSEDEKEFDKNVRKLLADKIEESQVFSPGTMPLFYAGCKICDEGVELHKAWVKADVEAMRSGGERPGTPVFRKHGHGI